MDFHRFDVLSLIENEHDYVYWSMVFFELKHVYFHPTMKEDIILHLLIFCDILENLIHYYYWNYNNVCAQNP